MRETDRVGSRFVVQQSRDDAMLALHAPPSIAGWLGGGGVSDHHTTQKGAQAEVAEPDDERVET